MLTSRDIVLLDGGTSLELSARSNNKTPHLWSAEYLMTEPDLVRAVHLDYIHAGAKIITTNTYSSTFTRMAMVHAEAEVPAMQRISTNARLGRFYDVRQGEERIDREPADIGQTLFNRALKR